MNPFVKQLLDAAGPVKFVGRPSLKDWAAAEADLGWELPGDYKELVSAFVKMTCFLRSLY